ncbi:hypothetical protein C0995_011021 [Termitomyces sp. Mi166|nr:hypothetical protein C0995_011021 [Termitomyces sp. Mi166\
MSSESSSDVDETSQTHSLEISGFSSSADSSLVPSPTGILSLSSSHASSSSSLDEKPNVKFAPLPELAPRKRQHAVPLGVAARSQMVLRRRQLRGIYHNSYHSHSMWTEEELEQQREFAMQEARRRHNQHHLLDEDDAEDPLLVLGRMIKDTGKTILRKVSIKDLSRKGKREKDSDAAREEENEHETGVHEAPTLKEDQRSTLTLRPKADEESFRTIGQTETIRERDAKYIWISEDLLDDPTGRTPTHSTAVYP